MDHLSVWMSLLSKESCWCWAIIKVKEASPSLSLSKKSKSHHWWLRNRRWPLHISLGDSEFAGLDLDVIIFIRCISSFICSDEVTMLFPLTLEPVAGLGTTAGRHTGGGTDEGMRSEFSSLSSSLSLSRKFPSGSMGGRGSSASHSPNESASLKI